MVELVSGIVVFVVDSGLSVVAIGDVDEKSSIVERIDVLSIVVGSGVSVDNNVFIVDDEV